VPPKPNSDRILELEALVASLVVQFSYAEKALATSGEEHQDTLKKFERLQREFDQTVPVLRAELNELKTELRKTTETYGNRIWGLAVGLLVVIVASVANHYFQSQRTAANQPTAPSPTPKP